MAKHPGDTSAAPGKLNPAASTLSALNDRNTKHWPFELWTCVEITPNPLIGHAGLVAAQFGVVHPGKPFQRWALSRLGKGPSAKFGDQMEARMSTTPSTGKAIEILDFILSWLRRVRRKSPHLPTSPRGFEFESISSNLWARRRRLLLSAPFEVAAQAV